MTVPATDPGPAARTGPDGGGTRRRRSWWRRAFYLASALLLGWAAAAVPLPYVEYLPGQPTPIEPLIDLEGVDTTDLRGETALLTVLLRQQPTLPALRAWLDDDRRLLEVQRVFPPGQDRQEFFRAERERFGRQFELAAAVGAAAAGVETELVTEVVILHVLEGAPADGRLRPGDVVVAVDGEPIVAAEELQAEARARDFGDELVLTVRRDGGRVETPVELGRVAGSEFPALGVHVQTAVDAIQLPFDVRLADGTRIGGPSAGLMVALTTYDLLSDEDLLDGRVVVGTGSIDADGRVGPVGGVPEKMVAAAEYGADVALVPALQLEEALTRAPDGLEVVGVATLDDAIEALRR
jgi:PDZ domain-containing protein